MVTCERTSSFTILAKQPVLSQMLRNNYLPCETTPLLAKQPFNKSVDGRTVSGPSFPCGGSSTHSIQADFSHLPCMLTSHLGLKLGKYLKQEIPNCTSQQTSEALAKNIHWFCSVATEHASMPVNVVCKSISILIHRKHALS